MPEDLRNFGVDGRGGGAGGGGGGGGGGHDVNMGGVKDGIVTLFRFNG